MMSFLLVLLDRRWIISMRWLYSLLLIVVIVLSLVPATEDVTGAMLLLEWLAGIFLGSADHADKVSHFLAYGVVTGVGMLGFIRPLGRFFLLPVVMLLLSVVLELAQGLVSGRSVDVFDVVANAAGVTTGAVVAAALIFASQSVQARREQPA